MDSARAAYKMMFNGRYIGTRMQDKPHRLNMPLQPPSRTQFLITRRVRVALIYYTWEAVNHAMRQGLWGFLFAPGMADLMPPKDVFIRRLGQISSREITTRSVLVLGQLWRSWAWYTGMHEALSIVHVGLGLDEPWGWPQFYGNLDEAYTVGLFWGRYWHVVARNMFTGYAKLVARVLGLPLKGPAGRIWVVLFVFAMSGVLHGLSARNAGFRCGLWAETAWYFTNGLAVVVEEAVIQACRAVMGPKRSLLGARVLGYCWVFALMFWSLPKLHSSRLMCAPLSFFLPGLLEGA